MKRDKIAKRVVQAIALCSGLCGLMCVYLGARVAVDGVQDSDRLQKFALLLTFLGFGGIDIAVAWQALRRFGPNAIRNVVALVVFGLFAVMDMLLSPILDAPEESRVKPLLVLAILLLVFVLYRVLSGKLIELTGANKPSNGQNHGVDPCERAAYGDVGPKETDR